MVPAAALPVQHIEPKLFTFVRTCLKRHIVCVHVAMAGMEVEMLLLQVLSMGRCLFASLVLQDWCCRTAEGAGSCSAALRCCCHKRRTFLPRSNGHDRFLLWLYGCGGRGCGVSAAVGRACIACHSLLAGFTLLALLRKSTDVGGLESVADVAHVPCTDARFTSMAQAGRRFETVQVGFLRVKGLYYCTVC